MLIVQIAPLENGAHDNQTYHGQLPEGWAVLESMEGASNFPFGNFDVEMRDGVPYAVNWRPLPILPGETQEVPIDSGSDPTAAEMAAAIREGVDGL